MKKQEVLDNLEAEREAKSQAKKDRLRESQEKTAARSKSGGGLNVFGLPGAGFLGGILKTFTQITAGLAAVSAGILGWRVGWLKSVKGTLKLIAGLPVISTGIRLVMRSLYGIFGLKPNMSGDGFTFKGIQGIKTASKLGFFGLLFFKIQGLFKTWNKTIGKGMKGGNKILRVFGSTIGGLFRTIGSLGRAVMIPLRPFMPFLRFGGRLFRGVFSKILLPIGVLISAFDGASAFMNSTESGILGRIGDFVGGFFGSFVGMPLNLIRDVFGWIVKKIIPGATLDDGTWDTENAVGYWMAKFTSLDFVQLIHALYKAPFKAMEGIINWFKSAWDSPEGFMNTMWVRMLTKLGSNEKDGLGGVFWNAMNKFATEAIPFMFGFELTEEQKKNVNMQKAFQKDMEKIRLFFRSIFPSLGFIIEKKSAEIYASFGRGFIDLKESFRQIPAKLKAGLRRDFGITTQEQFEEENRLAGLTSRAAELDLARVDAELASKLRELNENYMNSIYGTYMGSPTERTIGTQPNYDMQGFGNPNVTINQTNLVTDDSVTTQNTLDIFSMMNRERSLKSHHYNSAVHKFE